jgi:hypothetical protein
LFFGFGASSIRSVSRGNESGRMMYRTCAPRTVIVSRVTVSRFLTVYLTARSATFISGETEVMVPFTIVPGRLLEDAEALRDRIARVGFESACANRFEESVY